MPKSGAYVNGFAGTYFVTLHAIRRYLEREHRFRFRKGASDADVVAAWERVSGLSRHVIRDEIAAQILGHLGPAQSNALPQMKLRVGGCAWLIRDGNTVITYVSGE